jgi:hypothetical protein
VTERPERGLCEQLKMRKRLRDFVGKKAAVDILKWAVDNVLGHRVLLEGGGEQVLGEAVEYAAGTTLRYGQRLFIFGQNILRTPK